MSQKRQWEFHSVPGSEACVLENGDVSDKSDYIYFKFRIRHSEAIISIKECDCAWVNVKMI